MEVTRVTVDEVKERMDRGEPFFFIDTRNPQAWEQSDSKLPGAVHMGAGEVESRLAEIPRDRAVITYCTGPNEGSSARAAQILVENGWKSVHPLYQGFDAWTKAGYPLEPK